MKQEDIVLKESDVARLEAFSDGIFAFAITLLVLQITIPHIASLGKESLWSNILGQWPSFLSYLISFITIGIIWANHSDMFRHIVRSNHIFRMLNIFFLMSVAFIPYPTALLGEFFQNPANSQTAVSIYTGIMLLFASLYTLVWVYASTNKRLVYNNLDNAFLAKMTRRYLLGIGLYLIAFLISFYKVEISISLVIVITLMYFLPHKLISKSSI